MYVFVLTRIQTTFPVDTHTYRLVFKMHSSAILDYFLLYFILTSFFLCHYTGQLLVYFVPCCIIPDCCKLHIVQTACVFRIAG